MSEAVAVRSFNGKAMALILRSLAMAMALVYLGWQVTWLSQGRLPPSLFLALTGWPSPTTGCTRSFQALLSWNWRLSLYHNAMLLPILAVLLITVSWLTRYCADFGQILFRPALLKRSRTLPPWLVRAWIGVLSLAWIIKLVQAVMA